VVTTIKGDGAAPWIVVHADSPQENEKVLTEVLEGLLQTASEAASLFTGAMNVARGTGQPAQQQQPAHNQQSQNQGRQQVQQNQGGWNGGQQQTPPSFNGTPHPEGKTCSLAGCGALLVGKQPKLKKMWTCPNQRSQGDGHTVEWINS
jgi:hypothetical protein